MSYMSNRLMWGQVCVLHDSRINTVPASPGFIPCSMNDERIIWRRRYVKTATIRAKVFLALGLLTCRMSNHIALFMAQILIWSWHICLTATQTLRKSSTWMASCTKQKYVNYQYLSLNTAMLAFVINAQHSPTRHTYTFTILCAWTNLNRK
jgi:hypothetical protein